jgi:formylmethanofuran dehydrogenase subunit E
MTRILILIVLAWILYQIIKRVIAYAQAESAKQETRQNPAKNQDEKVLQCTQCGCHVPESETKVVNQQIICSNPDCNKVTHAD